MSPLGARSSDTLALASANAPLAPRVFMNVRRFNIFIVPKAPWSAVASGTAVFVKFHGGSFAAALQAMRNHQTSLSFRAKRGIPPCLMKSRETTNKARFLALLGMTANSQSREAFCLPLSAYCLPYRRLPKRGRTVSVRYCGTNRNSLVRCAACGNSRKPPSKLLSPAKADRAPRRCRGTPRIQRERPGASGG